MTRYTVDSDAVDSAAAAITATVSRLQTEVTSLHGQLETLQGVWTGAAAIAFQGVVQQWRTTQTSVEQVLSSIDRALRVAGQQYVETELANARLFG
ncbi:WXG100 family type VII secretion target [uncultured Amnibacterium sp.]|uniref:WXG100 family type VII secretion target n=1 Tax=uncultured Amnibacterium sp. TaxID=1631851 RepID=UPI0035C979BD